MATTYHFEYGLEKTFELSGTYEHTTASAEIAADAGAMEVHANLGGLEEGAAYRFRLVAESEAGATEGGDHRFETQERLSESCPNAEFRTGPSAGLPDCRAYELVTPGITNGAAIIAPTPRSADLGFNSWLTAPRGAEAGEALIYEAEPTLPGFEGSGVHDGYRAARGPGAHPAAGWQSDLLSFSHVQVGAGASYWRGGASDQRYSIWYSDPLSSFEGTLPAGAYLTIPGSIPPSACNPAPQPHFELVGCGALGPDPKATPQFLSASGAHLIFSSKAHLEEEAPAETTVIYDRPVESSKAAVLSLQPGGGAFGAGEDASYVAASEDGSTVLFKVGGDLYLRGAGQTTEIATPPAAFAGVSEDGGRVFFAAGTGEAPAGLFACDLDAGPCVGGGEAGLSQIAAEGIFVGVSPDGSRAFFSSEDALTGSEQNDFGETAQPDQPNLYAWSGGTVSFIAVLDPADFASFGGDTILNLRRWSAALTAATTTGRGNVPTRSTPDGGVLVFQSHAQIGDYDNEGRGEVYRYEPLAAPGGRLLCLSCDPSGAPPSADAMLQEVDHAPLTPKTLIPNVTDDGGRVFFESFDRLTPADANAARDVYEWRANGVGGCQRPGGCLALISSGQGEQDSFLFSMSADGHDVFIRTLDKLVPADVPGSFSIYDARVQGGIPVARDEEACHGDACQPAGSGPPALVVPATTESEGNLPGRRCGRNKHLVKGRCVRKPPRHGRKHRGRSHRQNGSVR